MSDHVRPAGQLSPNYIDRCAIRTDWLREIHDIETWEPVLGECDATDTCSEFIGISYCGQDVTCPTCGQPARTWISGPTHDFRFPVGLPPHTTPHDAAGLLHQLSLCLVWHESEWAFARTSMNVDPNWTLAVAMFRFNCYPASWLCPQRRTKPPLLAPDEAYTVIRAHVAACEIHKLSLGRRIAQGRRILAAETTD